MCAYKSDSKDSETAEDRFLASCRLEGTEAIVAGLYRVASEIPQLGLDDNLIALGIDSRHVLALVTSISRTFDRQVPVSAVYDHPTARTMTAWLLDTGEEGKQGPENVDQGPPQPPKAED